jgi:hypothetical protein
MPEKSQEARVASHGNGNQMKMYVTKRQVVVPIKRKQKGKARMIAACARDTLINMGLENIKIAVVTKPSGFSPPQARMVLFSI